MAARGSASCMGDRVTNFFLDNELEMKYLAAGIVAVVLWRIVTKMFLGSKPKLNLPRGPPNLPLLGAMLSVDGSDLRGWYQKMADKFGKVFYFRLGSHNIIVVHSVEGAKETLKTKDALFSNRPNEAFLKSTAKHHGVNSEDVVFSSFTENHKSLKKLLLIQFLTASSIKRYEDVRRPEGGCLVEDIQREINAKGSVNVSDALFNASVNTLSRLIFGRRCTKDSLTSETDPIQHCSEIVHLHAILALEINIGDFCPWLAWPMNILGLSNEARLQKFNKLYRKAFGQLIEEHREAKRTNKNYNNRTFMEVLVNVYDKGEISYDALLGSLMDLLVAGTETNAVAAEWAVLELVKNPDCLAKLQKEMDEVIGTKRPFEESDVPNLPYLQAVIMEIFRLHPPAPLLLPHFADEATTLQGFDIPAKTTIFVNAGAISKDPDYWEDPLKFDPERFTHAEEKINLTEGNVFELCPFGSGRRKCIGATMGLLSAQRSVGILAHAFDWSPLPGQTNDDIDRTEWLNGVNRPRTQLYLRAKLRFHPDVYNQLRA